MQGPTALHETPGQAPLLTDRRPVPRITEQFSAQLRLYTPDTLRQRRIDPFNPSHAREIIRRFEGKNVDTVDIGGDKSVRIRFTARGGLLVPHTESVRRIESHETGAGYVPFLEDAQREAARDGVPIGISTAGKVEGTRLAEYTNADAFMEAFGRYSHDFRVLMPNVTAVNNDAEAAIKTAILEAELRAYLNGIDGIKGVLLPIVGGGNGGAAFVRKFEGSPIQDLPPQTLDTTGYIFAMEPGHIELVNPMNPLGQKVPDDACGFEGQPFVCVENVIGGVKGIEARWEKTKGQHLSGREIGQLYRGGNALATQIYDTSATQLAVQILGMGQTLGLFQEDGDTLVAGHGSIFKEEGYLGRVSQILAQEKVNPYYTFTGNFSINAGSEGAAIAALMALAD